MKRESRTVDRSDQVDSPAQRHLPLVDLLVDTRAELMELAVASGLKVLITMCSKRVGHSDALLDPTLVHADLQHLTGQSWPGRT